MVYKILFVGVANNSNVHFPFYVIWQIIMYDTHIIPIIKEEKPYTLFSYNTIFSYQNLKNSSFPSNFNIQYSLPYFYFDTILWL